MKLFLVVLMFIGLMAAQAAPGPAPEKAPTEPINACCPSDEICIPGCMDDRCRGKCIPKKYTGGGDCCPAGLHCEGVCIFGICGGVCH